MIMQKFVLKLYIYAKCHILKMPYPEYFYISGPPHYKQKSRFFGSQSRLRDSKPHNNALHAFCGIETIELPLRSSHKKSVFEPRPAPSCKHYGKAFILRRPWLHLNSCSILVYFMLHSQT